MPPAQSDTFAYRTAGALAEDLAARSVSAVELLDDAVARIERCDAALNAVVVRDFARARRAAEDADAALERGERRPLLGVPMTVKESYNVAGLPTTWGMPQFATFRAAADAAAVARLKAAGAVVLGKTNVPFALGDWQSYNDIYGTTNNPWDLARTPGGSSGGGAAAVAAGYVALEMGSDIGGSLRAPAHFCGIFCHKPSRGVVPTRGHVLPGSTGGVPDLPVVGPLARSAADLTLALDAVAGPDDAEAVALHLRLPPPRHADLRGFRVLLIDSHPSLPAARSVRDALARLGARLRAAGVRVDEGSALLPDLEQAARVFVRLLMPVIFAREPLDSIAALAAAAAALPPDADTLGAWRLRSATAAHRDWLAADELRARMNVEWRALFREYDVLLFPPMPTPAFAHDHADASRRTIDIDGTAYAYFDQVVYAGLATPAGLPATVAPLERTAGGLPVGVQIIGPYLEDRTPLRFAELLEREYGGFVPPPGY